MVRRKSDRLAVRGIFACLGLLIALGVVICWHLSEISRFNRTVEAMDRALERFGTKQ